MGLWEFLWHLTISFPFLKITLLKINSIIIDSIRFLPSIDSDSRGFGICFHGSKQAWTMSERAYSWSHKSFWEKYMSHANNSYNSTILYIYYTQNKNMCPISTSFDKMFSFNMLQVLYYSNNTSGSSFWKSFGCALALSWWRRWTLMWREKMGGKNELHVYRKGASRLKTIWRSRMHNLESVWDINPADKAPKMNFQCMVVSPGAWIFGRISCRHLAFCNI